MIDHLDDLIHRYLESWNEREPARRRVLIQGVWVPAGRYVDPLAAVRGYDAIDALVGHAQQTFPGLEVALAGRIDACHDQACFSWTLGDPAAPAAVGFDVAIAAGDRLTLVLGFLDAMPAEAVA